MNKCRILRAGLFFGLKVVAVLFIFCALGSAFAKTKTAMSVAEGWSVDPDEEKAVMEAAAQVRQKLDPDFVVVLCEETYDDAKILKKLCQEFKDSKVFGYEVSYAVFTSQGVHRGEKGSLAILGIEASGWNIGVSAIDLSDAKKSSEIKKLSMQAIERAIADAGKIIDEEPSVVIIAATKSKEEPILETIEYVFGKSVKLIGGTSAAPNVIANDKVVEDGFSIAVIYADSKIGTAFHAGIQVDHRVSGIVTSMGDTRRIIKEIDGSPAFNVYNEWTGGVFSDVDIDNLKEPLSIWEIAGRTPLVRLYRLSNGNNGTQVSVPIKIMPDRSLMLGADLHEGDKIHCSLASQKAYIHRASTIVHKALVDGKIKKSELAGGLHIYCRGAAFGQIGKDVKKLNRIVAQTNSQMEGKPFIGGFTAGEQGTIPGYGCFQGNMSSAMVVFADKE